jgi:hypothetical protein
MAKTAQKLKDLLKKGKSIKELEGVKASKVETGSIGKDPGVDYAPKEKAGQDFVAKHKEEKHSSRAGNKDDVFSATNVKYSLDDKKKEPRHGYRQKEAEKVYEASETEAADCNMTPKGKKCPVHGLSECMSAKKINEDDAPTPPARPKDLDKTPTPPERPKDDKKKEDPTKGGQLAKTGMRTFESVEDDEEDKDDEKDDEKSEKDDEKSEKDSTPITSTSSSSKSSNSVSTSTNGGDFKSKVTSSAKSSTPDLVSKLTGVKDADKADKPADIVKKADDQYEKNKKDVISGAQAPKAETPKDDLDDSPGAHKIRQMISYHKALKSAGLASPYDDEDEVRKAIGFDPKKKPDANAEDKPENKPVGSKMMDHDSDEHVMDFLRGGGAKKVIGDMTKDDGSKADSGSSAWTTPPTSYTSPFSGSKEDDSDEKHKEFMRKAHKMHMAKEEYVYETLTKTAPAAAWIHDFVHSNNPKFSGDSKKQKIKRALGAYYGKQREDEQADTAIQLPNMNVDVNTGRNV